MLFFLSAAGQQQVEFKSIFLRIYNLEGAKISKGKLVNINEEGIVLQRGKKTFYIAASEIGKIKTKRALGHNMGIGAVVGTSIGAVIGASTGAYWDNFFDEIGAPEKTNFDAAGLLSFGLIGGAIGTATGAISGVSKKSVTFEINEQKGEFLKFRQVMITVFHY
jgi:peptidase E